MSSQQTAFEYRGVSAPAATFPSVHVRWEHHEPDIDVCSVSGEIDVTTEPVLRAALTDCERRAASRVVVDLSRVTFCGMEGARALHLSALRARRLLSMVLSTPVSLVLDTAGLGQHIARYAHLTDALTDAVALTS